MKCAFLRMKTHLYIPDGWSFTSLSLSASAIAELGNQELHEFRVARIFFCLVLQDVWAFVTFTRSRIPLRTENRARQKKCIQVGYKLIGPL